MKVSNRKDTNRFSLMDAIRSRISAYLYQVYAADDGLLGNLDHWTQRRITEENLAKLALVLDSDDPAETCYRDLIRELDTEAETGIYLVRSDSTSRHLYGLIDEPGVSGELYREMKAIAPIVFADETAHSADDLDQPPARVLQAVEVANTWHAGQRPTSGHRCRVGVAWVS